MTILITGGLGHIGSRLISELMDMDDLIVIDSLATQRFSSVFNLNKKNKLKLISESCQNVDVKRILTVSKPNSMVHLAADNEVEKFQSNPDTLRSNNFAATKWADAIARDIGIPLVFPSSTSIYNRSGQNLTEEETGDNPISNYAQVKKDEEDYLAMANLLGSRNFVLRLGTIYGISPGMRFHTAINNFCWKHANGMNLQIWGNAMNLSRPYLALADATAGIKKVIESTDKLPSLLNLVTDNLTTAEIVKLIEEISEREVKLDIIENSIMSDLSFSISTKLARSHNFIFNGKIENGIRETLQLLGGLKA